MAKGIIYVMSTVVEGLIKIGKTEDFDKRMRILERNGYFNITGLKREFAIEVEDYSEKERLIHTLFSKSRISDSELFSIDIDLAKQLLSSFEGKIIYPNENKEEIFIQATDAFEEKVNLSLNRHHFKEMTFYSSLTNKEYYTKTNNKGTLSIFEKETDIEVPNNSKPSKKQIIFYALKDLNIQASQDETLYQLVHRLEKVKE